MSFKFKNHSKDIPNPYEEKNENFNEDEEKISQINCNNLTSKFGIQYKPNMANGDMDEIDNVDLGSPNKNNKNFINNYNNNEEKNREEEIDKDNFIYKNETQFYELNTNVLVDIIKNDFNDIHMKQNEDIAKFVDKLAKENSTLKVTNNKLNLEILKLKTQNDYYKKSLIKKNELELINENNNTKQIELNLKIHEKEKENIKNEYESILVNNPSSLILKQIKSLYNQLIKCKDDLYDSQKISILLQEENDKLKEKNEYIKSHLSEEKNKIIENIIEIQEKMNSEIELNRNLIINNIDYFDNKNNNEDEDKALIQNDENIDNVFYSNNNPHSFYIDKLNNLTYEKNKLLSCNYDFFIKINDLSQTIEEKNNIINNQIQKNSKLESDILDLKNEKKILNLKVDECTNLIKELQDKNSELITKREENVKFDLKMMENKYNIMKSQYENKIAGFNDTLNNITKKYELCKRQLEEMKNKYEITKNSYNNYKIDNEKNLKEKNKLTKEINTLKTDIKLKEEQLIANKTENELQKRLTMDEKTDKYDDKIDYNSIKSSINNLYNNIISKIKKSNFGGNSNTNISDFIANNSNDLVKLNEINKQINILLNNEHKSELLNIENEKLKRHIKEIINIALEHTSLTYIREFNQDYNSINIEILILKIINYIKVIKVCFHLQKIKTGVNYCEKYLNWLNEKEYFKNNNSSIIELKNITNKINGEIDTIKNTIKNNSLNLEKKFKNFLTKDEVKNEINEIQKKYEKIISDLFEYFLKYKIINKKNHEFLTLQIPIKSYNLMIENNMNNISLIGQSIESWNLYIHSELDNKNDSSFQEIINLTNINNLIEYNNIDEVVNNNNESTNNNNINDFIDKNNESINNTGDNNRNDNDSDENNTQTSHPLESKSQYSFDNKH